MNTESDYARQGTEALAELKNRDTGTVPDGLFDRIVEAAAQPDTRHRGTRGFWLGTSFGAAVAASIFTIAVIFGWLGDPVDSSGKTERFQIAFNESRSMDIAIETDRVLAGATISVILAGNVELDGFAGKRELTWTEDLDVGVNRLTLPLIATGTDSSQLLVRLSHPQSEQVFIINLGTDT